MVHTAKGCYGKSIECQNSMYYGKRWSIENEKRTRRDVVIIDASVDDITITHNGCDKRDDGTKNHMQNRHFSVSLAVNRKSIETNASGKIIVCYSVDTIATTCAHAPAHVTCKNVW